MRESVAKPIFVSYASQDTEAVRRISDALRAAGLEVWFDQSELRGGDAWDTSIRKQIKECALFVPIISASTQAREEGYFRLEWKLAVDRSQLMAAEKTFLVPVVIDDTRESAAMVPAEFKVVQWTRLPNGENAEAFAERVGQLLSAQPFASAKEPAHEMKGPSPAKNNRRAKGRNIALAIAATALIGLAIYFTIQAKTSTKTTPADASAATPSAGNPLSIMVMPFANQTGDLQKSYVADALTSSITSDLSRVRDAFIVPTATAFGLRDKKLTISQLGREAGVRFVLSGSVTSNGAQLRIIAQLSDTQSGAQLWTENFDGSQSDLFALQDLVTLRIGNSIGPQMVIAAARDSEKRKSTPQVIDLLMRAKALSLSQQSLKNLKQIEALYRQVLNLEPDNVKAKMGLAWYLALQATNFDHELKLDARGQIALAKQAADLAQDVREVDPQEPMVYGPIAAYATLTRDLRAALQANRRQLELQPKYSAAYSNVGLTLLRLGDAQEAKAVLEKGLQFTSPARPPAEIYGLLSWAAFILDHPDDAIDWAQKAANASPNRSLYHRRLALAYALKGDRVQAAKVAAECVRLDPTVRLDVNKTLPWPGKEEQYRKYIETKYLPAWRLAGLPE